MKTLCRSLLCVAALGLDACAVGPDVKTPRPAVPTAFVASTEPGTAAAGAGVLLGLDLTQWWRSLHDTELNSLVGRAIEANPDIAIALIRLQEARAQEYIIIGSSLPSGELSAGTAAGTGSDNSRGRVSQTLHSGGNTAGYSQIFEAGGFDFTWELDAFGRFRREVEAARFDVLAAAKIRQAVLVTVIANVARAYVDLRALQAQIEVAKRNIETARRSLNLVRTRFNQGLTNDLDVKLAERQLATFQAGLSPLAAQITASQYVIAVLIGQYPEKIARELAVVRPIPTFPARVPVGIPVTLLQRRPDIQAIELELDAATARIGVAMADLFPRINITGSLGGQGGSTAPTGNRTTLIGTFGPSLYWPVLDFGTLDAKIQVADLKSKETLQRLKGTILQAVQEVDGAIASYRAQQNRLVNLGHARTAAHEAVTLSSERYERGLTDFLNVLDAERQEFDIEAQYVAAQQATGDSLVGLYKALGGGWEHYTAVPEPRRPQPAVVAAVKLIGTPAGPRPVPLQNPFPKVP